MSKFLQCKCPQKQTTILDSKSGCKSLLRRTPLEQQQNAELKFSVSKNRRQQETCSRETSLCPAKKQSKRDRRETKPPTQTLLGVRHAFLHHQSLLKRRTTSVRRYGPIKGRFPTLVKYVFVIFLKYYPGPDSELKRFRCHVDVRNVLVLGRETLSNKSHGLIFAADD